MSSWVVRPATVEDAAGIAAVHILAWQQSYARLVEPGELDGFSVERRADRWRTIIEAGDVGVWVAEFDGVIGGFSSSAARNDDAPRPLELEAIYVLEEHHGSGAGQALLNAAVGDLPAYLSVARDNPRALAFYRRNRFRPDGHTDRHPLVRTPIPTVRLVR